MDTVSNQDIITEKLQNPFPGLRPFHPNEAHLFFGRDGQSEEILENLAKNRFAAILGASGSGKSSLIYCGLLPILHGGFLHNGRSKWRIAISRPGSDPTANLAYSLAETFSNNSSTEEIESDALINQAVVKRSAEGISNVINQYGLAPDENVLILVDQLEELFRYQYSGKDSDALDKVDHFINLLVNIVRQQVLPVYVVITMRSDFIGDCSPFQHFTRLINDSHYLIPRMTRDDFRKAITGPVSVGEGKISDQLVQLLLNEMGNNPDHLPILQHALMRTWEYWVNHSDTSFPMGITEYEAIGRLERALSNHANDAYYELSVDEKRTCEVVFKSLTEKGADNRGIRRPTSVIELAAIAETTTDEVISVVEVFRKKGRTFLTPAPEIELTENSLVDISHESLMRVWDKLKIWVEDEANAVKMYIRLAESADLYSEGKANLWGPPDLQLAITWREKQNPNLAWATRYHPAFERTMVYLRTSEEEYIAEEENKIRLQKRALRRARIFTLILGTAGMIAIGLGILALIQRQDALKAQSEAVEQKDLAEVRRVEAEQQKLLAEESEKVAREQKDRAEESQRQAEIERQKAERNAIEAEKQRRNATQKEQEAQVQREKAVESEKEAKEQQRLAELAKQEAEQRRMLSIAQSMAVKSQQMRTDTLLKGLLAYQAFHFNKDYQGVYYNPDVFKSLYSGISFFKGSDYNLFPLHTSLVRTLLQIGNSIYSAGSDGLISTLDTQWKNPKTVLGNLSIVKKIVEYDGFIYALTNNGILRYNLSAGSTELFPYTTPEIRDLFITNQGKFIIVFNQSVSISEGFGKAATEIYRGEGKINATKYNPLQNNLYVAFADGRIVTLSVNDSQPAAQSMFVNIPESNWGEIGYNPIKNILAGGFGTKEGTVYIWNAQTKQQISILRGHIAKITGIAFSANGKLMATASYDGTVRLWHLDDLNTLPIVFDDHESWVTSVMFTNDDQYIVSGGRNGKIRVYPVDVNTMESDYCNYITRELTQEEWNSYVGEDIPYNPKKCAK
jgi:hypothetical protein